LKVSADDQKKLLEKHMGDMMKAAGKLAEAKKKTTVKDADKLGCSSK